MSLVFYFILWILLGLAASPIIGALFVPLEDWSEVPSGRAAAAPREVESGEDDPLSGS